MISCGFSTLETAAAAAATLAGGLGLGGVGRGGVGLGGLGLGGASFVSVLGEIGLKTSDESREAS